MAYHVGARRSRFLQLVRDLTHFVQGTESGPLDAVVLSRILSF